MLYPQHGRRNFSNKARFPFLPPFHVFKYQSFRTTEKGEEEGGSSSTLLCHRRNLEIRAKKTDRQSGSLFSLSRRVVAFHMRCLDTPPSSSVPSGGEFDAGLSWPVSVSPAPPFHSHGNFFRKSFFSFRAVFSVCKGDGILH